MSRWSLKRSSLLLLGSVVFIMLLIVVLPFVDLPDTAFHRGTAPVAVHSQATSAPAVIIIAVALVLPQATEVSRYLREPQIFAVRCAPNFLPILLHVVRR